VQPQWPVEKTDWLAGKVLERYEVMPIGWIASPLTEPAQAPRQGEGAPPAWLVLSDHVAEAIRDLRVGDIKPVLDPKIEQ
jgi:tRNA (Thr-GGU) A37 N-methylase